MAAAATTLSVRWYLPRYQPAASVLPNAFGAFVVTAILVSGKWSLWRWPGTVSFSPLDDSSELVLNAMTASGKWSVSLREPVAIATGKCSVC
jgi:hypothetical protein